MTSSASLRRASWPLSSAIAGSGTPAFSATIRTASGNDTRSISITKLKTLPPFAHPKQ